MLYAEPKEHKHFRPGTQPRGSVTGVTEQLLRSCRPATEVSRALRARVSRGVSPRVSPKTGVSDGVFHGMSPKPFGPRTPECPKSVPRVSPECLGHLFDTLGTHSRDTHSRARGPKGPKGPEGPEGPGDTPWDTPSDTPVFGDTLGDTRSPGTLGPEGRETSVGRRDRKAIVYVPNVCVLKVCSASAGVTETRCAKGNTTSVS